MSMLVKLSRMELVSRTMGLSVRFLHWLIGQPK